MSALSGKSYLDEFDSKKFLSSFYGPSKEYPNQRCFFDFYREQLYKFYVKYNCKWDKNTARLLEFGGGPVIISLISSVPYIHEITFSAYLESERKEVQLWKDDKEGAHDWRSHIKHAVNEIEHIGGDDAWCEREALLRKRICAIVPCNILCENPLFVKQEPFEIISTSLCIEVACTSYPQYKEAIKKLVGLLKPGGFLLMYIVERETFYMFGKKKWSCLYLTLEQVKEALTDAGTAIVVAKRDPASMEEIQNPVVSDHKAFLFVVAQKVEF